MECMMPKQKDVTRALIKLLAECPDADMDTWDAYGTLYYAIQIARGLVAK